MIQNKTLKMILIALVLVLAFILYSNFKSTEFDDINLFLTNPTYFNDFNYNKSLLQASFEKNFIKDILPKTNLIVLDDDNLASGNDILSESLGLMMQLAIYNNDKELFDRYLVIMDNQFIKPNGLLKWRISEELISNNVETVNATVDDLRIVKVLFQASDLWNDPKYTQRANEIGDSLLSLCVSNDKLLSYDNTNSPEAILTYYDFKAMLLLSNNQVAWKNIISHGINKIEASQIEDLPFYFDDENNYKSIENLLILMHLYEVGYEQPESINFIKDQILNGGYYGVYDQYGNPVEMIESPAIYGIIAQIAKLANDKHLYQISCEKLVILQNPITSNYYGGYVNETTHEGYSFDHLMALLGF